MSAKDPNINKHPPVKLRWFAARFQENAAKKRVEADELDKKAARYIKKADKLEKVII